MFVGDSVLGLLKGFVLGNVSFPVDFQVTRLNNLTIENCPKLEMWSKIFSQPKFNKKAFLEF